MIDFFPSRAVALSLGSLHIHWYGIMYLLAFLLGLPLVARLQKFRNLQLSAKQLETLSVSVFLGVLLGGRLGFVMFYGGTYYREHVMEVLAVWHGGMSSHGGFIGVAIALLLFARRQKISLFALTDALAVPVAVGLALGRVGNLINGELYGTLTTVPWGMHFPGVEGLRHPTQLYAIAKDLCIALVCMRLLTRENLKKQTPGLVTASLLILYAILRSTVEIFRDQPYGYANVAGILISRGQLLTVPVFLLGIAILLFRRRSKRQLAPSTRQ